MNLFSVLTSKIFGGVAVALAAALIWLYISTSATIASYKDAIHNPETGWKAALNTCTTNLATARGNAATLGDALDRQNEALERVKAAAAARQAAGAAERAKAEQAVERAKAQNAKLATTQAGADMCVSADQLILENVK
jgi:hypothetical protein